MMLRRLLCLLIFLSPASALAQNLYVTDQLYLSLRSGPADEYPTIRTLKSGNVLEVLSEGEQKGYINVRTPRGETGWVLRRFLEQEPPAAQRLEVANEALEQVRTEAAALQQQVSSLKGELAAANREIQARDAAAAEVAPAAVEQAALPDSHVASSVFPIAEEQRWFLLGGGAVLLGILVGMGLKGRSYSNRSIFR